MEILLSEADKTAQAQIANILTNTGHNVTTAMDNNELLLRYQKLNPDVVLIGCHSQSELPADIVKTLHTDDNKKRWTPIILMGDHTDAKFVEIAIQSGADDIIPKPVDPILLESKFRAIQRIFDYQSRLIELNGKLKELATIDPLTHLYNRIQFDKTLRAYLSRSKRHNKLLAVLFIDLDNFQVVNDTLGHHIGDMLLKQIGLRLQAKLRREDVVCRLGGDEFGIIISDIFEPFNSARVAQKVMDILEPAFNLEGQEYHITCSIGIACYPNAGDDPISLCKNSDIAMFRAKKAGKNTYAFFTKELHEQYTQHLLLENALKYALEKDQLSIVFQPQVDIQTRDTLGFEVLLRWHHPQLGHISPTEFIPIAEETGAIISIGYWVIEQACKQQAKWIMAGYKPLKLSINLSPKQLLQRSLADKIIAIVEKYEIPPHMLEFELTETSIMADSPISLKELQVLTAMGMTVSVDDFGTGYSSLSHLKLFPISALKIDKSFISEMEQHVDNALIVKSVINLAMNLNLNVIAEGVETATQLEFLIEHNCQVGQGYYFAKPLTPKEVESTLQH